MQLSYPDAVNYVLIHHAAVYTFIPIMKGSTTIGGSIYILHYEDDPEDFPDHYGITYAGGLFHSSSAEEGSLSPEEVPQEARNAHYTPVAPHFQLHHTDYELQIILKILQGVSVQEALEDHQGFRPVERLLPL